MAFYRNVLIGSFALALGACSSDDDATDPSNGPVDPKTSFQGTADKDPLPLDVALPIVFVHGFAGSAQQYESQAIRFAANGYPRERIRALDHDGAGTDYMGYVRQVDALVDEVRSEFGVEKVFLIGHSRGTAVSSRYLYDATRAAKIAKYISLDGFGCSKVNGEVMGAVAEPLPAEIPCDAPNQTILEGQAHVEVATSADSFKMQYEFLVGTAPTVVDIVQQNKAVQLSGRVVNFPANTGRAGTTLEVYEINPETGHRLGAVLNTFSIDETGEWGPIVVSPEKRYEFASIAETGTQHFYPQRYLRSSHLVRFLSGPADSPIRLATNRGPNHAAVIAMRMREWYADPNPTPMGGGALGTRARSPDKMDALEISTSSAAGNQPATDIIAPRMTNADIAIHIHDDTESPGVSTYEPLPKFADPMSCPTCTAFQTTADVFMPAADPPNGTITFKNVPRGDGSKPQEINVPNWASSGHLITLQFSDYPQ